MKLSSIGLVALLASLVTAEDLLFVEGFQDREYGEAIAMGYTAKVVSETDWRTMTAADFATYKAIILSSSNSARGESDLQFLVDTKEAWGPAVLGNIILIGTDPSSYFTSRSCVQKFVNNTIKFAADGPTENGKPRTGLYFSLSCHYDQVDSSAVQALSYFGEFQVRGNLDCYNDAHLVAGSPALNTLTDEALSNWGCSVHQIFSKYPSVGLNGFQALAIAKDILGEGSQEFGDGVYGLPYIISRGATPNGCGNGKFEPELGEECDDGNMENGDGCSLSCKCESGIANGDGTCKPKDISTPSYYAGGYHRSGYFPTAPGYASGTGYYPSQYYSSTRTPYAPSGYYPSYPSGTGYYPHHSYSSTRSSCAPSGYYPSYPSGTGYYPYHSYSSTRSSYAPSGYYPSYSSGTGYYPYHSYSSTRSSCAPSGYFPSYPSGTGYPSRPSHPPYYSNNTGHYPTSYPSNPNYSSHPGYYYPGDPSSTIPPYPTSAYPVCTTGHLCPGGCTFSAPPYVKPACPTTSSIIGVEVIVHATAVETCKTVDGSTVTYSTTSICSTMQKPIYNTPKSDYPCYVCEMTTESIPVPTTEFITVSTTVCSGAISTTTFLPTLYPCNTCSPVTLTSTATWIYTPLPGSDHAVPYPTVVPRSQRTDVVTATPTGYDPGSTSTWTTTYAKTPGYAPATTTHQYYSPSHTPYGPSASQSVVQFEGAAGAISVKLFGLAGGALCALVLLL